MLKLAALAGLGYAGYKYYQKNGNPFDKSTSGNSYSGVNRTVGSSTASGGSSTDSSSTAASTPSSAPAGGSSSFSASPSLKAN